MYLCGGSAVRCRAADSTLRFFLLFLAKEFAKGTVTEHWSEGNAYKVHILEGPEEGDIIAAAMDRDEFIKLAPKHVDMSVKTDKNADAVSAAAIAHKAAKHAHELADLVKKNVGVAAMLNWDLLLGPQE